MDFSNNSKEEAERRQQMEDSKEGQTSSKAPPVEQPPAQENDAEQQIGPDGRNANVVVCNQCQSVIFRRNVARFERGPSVDLPLPYQKRERGGNGGEAEVQTEPHDCWWTVTDMFAFENVGFTHSFQGRKFLACADCEIGPIGVVCGESGKLMVAVQRVQHDDMSTAQ